MRLIQQKGHMVVVLTAKEAAKYKVANVAPSAPPERTYATKKDRAAGNGFKCPQCARNDLRVATHPGSYHDKDVNGSGVRCEIA